MQTIEKALHQPMPFTTGGQTITDRLTAAKHSLAGSQLGKTICKATTEELMAPKKKHLDSVHVGYIPDLLHCTNEPNVSIPSMANLLIERTQNPNWTVVYKALITIHNIMCYGNEYLASCNTTFNLGSFLDKGSTQGKTITHIMIREGGGGNAQIFIPLLFWMFFLLGNDNILLVSLIFSGSASDHHKIEGRDLFLCLRQGKSY
ncbi:unnamed protein product [Toxocara canis]|uniref:ENTH domain-containing protein n=1 Tax=Toxocara canis TaxID=6265 RepID=A0A183VCY1_TOXCA|nr:unnamed protein product [Toxocara canis]